MTLLQIFEAVCRKAELSQGRFLALYRQTVSELLGEFESGYVLLSPDDFRLSGEIDIHDDAPHLEEYDASVIDNILYLNDRADTASKQFSLSERADAYRRVWMKKNKRRNGNARAW